MEVIVIAVIITILAGILVPMIFSQIDEGKITSEGTGEPGRQSKADGSNGGR